MVSMAVGVKLEWKGVLRVKSGLMLVMAVIPGFVKTLCRLVSVALKAPEVTQTLVLGMNL